ncbi:small membrane protein [Marmoricola sp. URHA0025 HA25]
MIIKILLIAAAIAFGFVLLRDTSTSRHLALIRITGILVVGGGIFAVLFPLKVTYVANKVGVARGTDLVLYVLVMVFLFTSVSLYQRLHTVESQISELTRHLALMSPRGPENEADE